jgi:hypothetical protein
MSRLARACSRMATSDDSHQMTRTRLATQIALTAIVFAIAMTQAQSPSTAIRGSWSATAGPNQVFQGTWTAELASSDPNAAQGSWMLLNRANQIVAQGTWSAVKAPRAWSGSWEARVLTKGGATSRLLSGNWSTQIADADVRTLQELLHKTLSDVVSGRWGSGRLAGAWSLRAFP